MEMQFLSKQVGEIIQPDRWIYSWPKVPGPNRWIYWPPEGSTGA